MQRNTMVRSPESASPKSAVASTRPHKATAMVAAFSLIPLLAMAPFHALAQTRSQVYGGPVERKVPTVYARGDAGYSTYESKMAGSNASGTTMRYGMGAFAGERRLFGISFTNSDTRMAFPLNSSKVSTSFRDLRAQGRLGFVFPTVVASLAEVKGEREGEELVDLYGTGFGGGLGMQVPLYERLAISGEGMFVRTNVAHDKESRVVELGDRFEADVSVGFEVVPRFLDLNVGYSYRLYSVSVESEKMRETQSTPYAGLRLGVFF